MIRHSGYRCDVIRDGAVWGQLRCAEAPRVDMNADAAITRSLTLTCAYDPGVQWLSDAVRPVLLLDGEAYSMGVFYPASCRESVSETGEQLVRIDAYDRAYLLSRSRTETRLHFDAGDRYLAAVDSLLLDAGIALRRAEPSDAVLATDREDWDIGTSRLDIVNQLLSEINYAPIWFDQDGWARIEPIAAPRAENSVLVYGGTGRTVRRVRTAGTRETDAFGAANVFVAICGNPDYDEPMQAVSVNESPLSALSTVRIGQRIAEVVKVDNIASQEALQAYADNLRLQSMMRGQMVEIETPVYPGHGCRDVITLNHPALGGIWQETKWSIRLGPEGTMTHKLERVVLV